MASGEPMPKPKGYYDGFTDGKQEGEKTFNELCDKREEIKQEGRREVVEWIKTHKTIDAQTQEDTGWYNVWGKDLEAKLKEWGIEA